VGKKTAAPVSRYEAALADEHPLAEWCEALATKPKTRHLSPELIYDAAVRNCWDERRLRLMSPADLAALEVPHPSVTWPSMIEEAL